MKLIEAINVRKVFRAMQNVDDYLSKRLQIMLIAWHTVTNLNVFFRKEYGIVFKMKIVIIIFDKKILLVLLGRNR